MPKGHSLYHYATRADYEPVFADVAALLAVKYAVSRPPVRRTFPTPAAADFTPL